MGGDRVQRSGRASGWTRDSLFLLDDCVLLCVLWGDPLQDQQTGEGQRDPDPPQRYFSFTKDQLPKECLQTKRSTVLTPICSTHTTNPPKPEAPGGAGTHRGNEVGGGGGHSGPGGGRRVPESLGQDGPHASVAGEEQASAQQPQRDVELGQAQARVSHLP